MKDPKDLPDHPKQAVELALAMRDRVAELSRSWNKRGIRLGAGIGIATGYATIGVLGFEGRQDYSAIGPVTNLAARLCSEAQENQILLSGRCLQLVDEYYCNELVDNFKLKGFLDPVPVYNITRIK